MIINELISNCRLLETDHDPDGWPAIRMKDVTALCDEIERLTPEFSENDDLTIAYMTGAYSRDSEVLALKQDRDQLKSIIDVIDSKIPITPNTFGGSYMIMLEQSDIDLLRQKAQEAE